MLLETFYIGRRGAYRSVAAASAHEPHDDVILIAAPAGSNRLWRLDSEGERRPYITADWAMAWKLASVGARRVRPLEVVA
ncbi:MAG: hypothetical protein RIM84_22430 [Alphaproteobacteria bacterium]